ncbi:MAG: tetratricopeptide repeat protein [Caldilineaceae bacterium]|nr:tetratricopeptide repeat protein [Caldilineaceae bacterium]
MTGRLELHVLGGCQIADAGEALAELTLNKARALLVYLAVTNRQHSRSHLIDLLWTDLPESDARRNLRVVLTKLRQAIGPRLETTRTHVALAADALHRVDVTAFVAAESLLLTAAEPWTDSTVNTIAVAFALYQGDFLAGLEVPHAPGFEEWMLLERERYRQLAFQYGERLAHHYEGVNEEHNAIDLCRRLLAIEPWQETIHRRLMTLLARTGQPTAALQQYEQCRRLLADELAVEPEGATKALYERIRQDAVGESTQGVQQATVRLPAPPPGPLRSLISLPTTPFFGRAKELAQLADLLADPACRLLTLVGPGGIGKTRLAQEVAQQFAGEAALQPLSGGSRRFSDGIFFIAATSLPTFDELISVAATTLSIAFAGQDALETQLLNQLAARRILLVFDNFEHLVPVADRIQRWLQEVPGLTLLVTSRERLNLSAEWLFPVHGLPVPLPTDDEDALTHNDAVQLFVRRAQRVNLGFAWPIASTAERTALVAICRLLEGLPLALELAAAWTRTHSCVEILLEIRANLDFLAGDLRDVPARHRSLRAAFDHSWRLLEHADALMVQRLVLLPAGFRATFSRQVAQATPAALMRLVDKSFLQRSPGGRYTMHELLRQYVVQQLNAEEADEIFLRYARAYGPWMQSLRASCESAEEPETLETVSTEFENLRVVWQWLLASYPTWNSTLHTVQRASVRGVQDGEDEERIGALQIFLSMISYFYLRRSRYREGVAFLAATITGLEACGWSTRQRLSTAPDAVELKSRWFLAQLSVALADIRFHLSEFPDVVRVIEESLPTLRICGKPADEANALTILGKAQIRMGRYGEAEQTLQQSLTLYQTNGQRKASAATLNALGILYSNQGHFAKAATYYEAYLAIGRDHGYQRGIANALNNLGTNYARNGEHERALPFYRETYEMAQIVGEELMLAVALSNLGSAARALGRFADAQQHYAESLAHCRAMGEQRWTAAGLNGLGFTLLDSGDAATAVPHFREALTIAESINSTPDLLDALAGIALALAASAPTVAVVALLTFVANHAVTQALSRQRCSIAVQTICTAAAAAIYPEALALAERLDVTAAVALARTDVSADSNYLVTKGK